MGSLRIACPSNRSHYWWSALGDRSVSLDQEIFRVMNEFRVGRGGRRFWGLRERNFHTGVEEISAVVNFDKSCVYKFSDIGDKEGDINKLFGVSFGILPRLNSKGLIPAHHINSLRIGWRPIHSRRQKCIELFLYWYLNGERGFKSITKLPLPGSNYDIRIAFGDGVIEYLVADTDHTFVIAEGQQEIAFPANRWGYVLYPYFGGNAPAPWGMKIKLDKIRI